MLGANYQGSDLSALTDESEILINGSLENLLDMDCEWELVSGDQYLYEVHDREMDEVE